jgi:hypothetical protein
MDICPALLFSPCVCVCVCEFLGGSKACLPSSLSPGEHTVAGSVWGGEGVNISVSYTH